MKWAGREKDKELKQKNIRKAVLFLKASFTPGSELVNPLVSFSSSNLTSHRDFKRICGHSLGLLRLINQGHASSALLSSFGLV